MNEMEVLCKYSDGTDEYRTFKIRPKGYGRYMAKIQADYTERGKIWTGGLLDVIDEMRSSRDDMAHTISYYFKETGRDIPADVMEKMIEWMHSIDLGIDMLEGVNRAVKMTDTIKRRTSE